MNDRSHFMLAAGAILFAAASMTAAQHSAEAQTAEPSLVGQYGDWGVYVNKGQKNRVCFAMSQPQERLPAELRRGQGYIFISSRPADNVRNEFSVMMGYALNEDVEPQLQVGSESFALYARGESAWIRNVAEEPRLIEALRKGSSLVLASTSARGNKTTDRYSLSGVSQALQRVAQECN